jgi:hypothetical protein
VGNYRSCVILQVSAIEEPRRRERCQLIQRKAAPGEAADATQVVGRRDGGVLTLEKLRYSVVGQFEARLVQLEA